MKNMPSLKRLLFTFVCAGLTSALTTGAQAADPFVIDVVLPVTGPAAFLGKAQSNSLELIEQIVNKGGGINGRRVKFVVHDDQTSPQTAVQLTNSIDATRAAVIIGSAMVAACNAMAPLAKDGPVMYCLSPAAHPASGSYMFSSGFSTKDLLVAVMRYLRNNGWHRVATITSADATGQDADSSIDGAVALPENKDQVIVAREHFAPADVTVAAQISDVKAAKPDALIVWTTGTPFGTVLRGIFDAGLNVPVVTTPGNMTFEQMKAYAQFLPADLLIPTKPAFALDQLPNGPVRNAVVSFQNAFKAANIRPDEGYISLWDASFLIVEAYRKLGVNASATEIRDYIDRQRNWAGVDGTYDFVAVPQRGIGVNSVMMVRWNGANESWSGVSKLGGNLKP
jgi:branched-chain amino acid transport system substrate-binding protein